MDDFKKSMSQIEGLKICKCQSCIDSSKTKKVIRKNARKLLKASLKKEIVKVIVDDEEVNMGNFEGEWEEMNSFISYIPQKS